MHPILYEIHVPSFLQGFLPDVITIYTYGALIALGAIFGSIYLARQTKIQFGTPYHVTNNLILLILVLAIIGGKLLFYLENPSVYIKDPSRMLRQPGQGFVFYGSLIFSVTGAIIFFRKHKLNVLKMIDLLAITACIVHFFGRLGCFNAGCCYGHPHDGIFSVVFTNPVCMAKPLNTPLHPTQLYSAFLILSILIFLFFVKKRQQFDGQIFLLYIMLYSIGRGIIEIFRGDLQRGFIIDDVISHSQFIALILFSVSLYFYIRLRKKAKT